MSHILIDYIRNDILNNNAVINNAFNRALYSEGDARVLKLSEKMAEIDSIDDAHELKKIRCEIHDTKRVSSKNPNFFIRNIYGYWDALYTNIQDENEMHYPTFEHGLNVCNDVCQEDLIRTVRPVAVTFGKYREKIILDNNPELLVFAVGPYSHYAKDYYCNERIGDLKKKNGKTLLVFPRHTIPGTEQEVNISKYIETIRDRAKEFDTVLVNAFWWNINDDIIKAMTAEGYKIVSAGYQYDSNFIRRLKTIIKLSDLAIGDALGTHIGFCIDEGVPFCMLPRNSSFVMETDSEDYEFVTSLEDKIRSVFLNAKEIGEKQIEACNYYWGLNKVKTREEMQTIKDINTEIFELSHGKRRLMARTVKEIMHSNTNIEQFIRNYSSNANRWETD